MDPYQPPQVPSRDHIAYRISKLEIGEIIEQAVQLTKNHFGLFLGIAAVVMIPMQVIFIVANLFIPVPPGGFNPQRPPTPQEVEAIVTAMLMILPLLAVYFWVILPITNAALIHAIASKYLGAPVTVGQAFAKVFRSGLSIIGTSIIVNLAISIGAILCCVPGIIAYLLFALAIPVVVIEGIAGFGALQRSIFLVKDNYLTVFVLAVMMFFINMGVNWGVGFVPTIYLHGALQIATTTVLFIFQSALFVVFYFSARCMHENFDLDILAASVVEPPMK